MFSNKYTKHIGGSRLFDAIVRIGHLDLPTFHGEDVHFPQKNLWEDVHLRMVEPKAAPKPGNFWREKNNEKQMWPCENEFQHGDM